MSLFQATSSLFAIWRPQYASRAAVAVVVAGAAGLFGWAVVFTYEGRVHSSRHQAERELQAISQLQAEAVASWREQRFADAYTLVDDVLLARAVAEWQRAPTPGSAELVQGRLRILQERAKYAAVFFADASGQLWLAPDDSPQLRLPDPELAAMQTALTQAQVVASGPRVDPMFAFPFFSTVAPLFDGATPLGSVWLVSDVRSTLYPQLSQWPTASATSESSIVTRQGDEVVYLSPLRHAVNAGLGMRSLLTRTKDPAVQAVLGARGIFSGEDYRSAQVIAVASTVPDSPWLLVTKIDQSEVLTDARQREIALAQHQRLRRGGIGVPEHRCPVDPLDQQSVDAARGHQVGQRDRRGQVGPGIGGERQHRAAAAFDEPRQLAADEHHQRAGLAARSVRGTLGPRGRPR